MFPKFTLYPVRACTAAILQLFQLGSWTFRKVSRFYCQNVSALESKNPHESFQHGGMLATASQSFLRNSNFLWIFLTQGLLLHHSPFPWGTSPAKQDTRAFPLLLLSLIPLWGDKTTGMRGSSATINSFWPSESPWQGECSRPDLCWLCKMSVVGWKIWSCVLISGFYYKCTRCVLFWGPGFSPAWNCQD